MKIISEHIINDFKRKVRTVIGSILVLCAFVQLLAFCTYSSANTSFNTSSTYTEANILKFLYKMADMQTQYWGVSSYLLAVVCLILGIIMILGKQPRNLIKKGVLLVISGISLSTLINYTIRYDGLLGYLLCNCLTDLLGCYGEISAIIIPLILSLVFLFTFAYMIDIKNLFLWICEKKYSKKHNKIIQEQFIAKKEKARNLKLYAVGVSGHAGAKTKGVLPSLSLLNNYEQKIVPTSNKTKLNELKKVLHDFGVKGEVVNIKIGPVVTLYEFEPAPGIKSSRVISLAGDIARSISATSVRIANIPGRNVLGIEIPNNERETVYLKELMQQSNFYSFKNPLCLVLGKNIIGESVVVDLSEMPHLLVAGTTGSGKSVAINAMILSILYKTTAEECRFIMIDPKMLELSVYEGIPHLLTPVVTDPKKAVAALKWTVKEMERRYQVMSKLGVRNIQNYNDKIKNNSPHEKSVSRKVHTGFDTDGNPILEKEDLGSKPLPYIIVVVDEMADLMLVSGKEIEVAVQRLAQMARAAGIHIIMATQRPSVDVVTGTIKANFPTRISFHVTSKIDSRTILGEQGAEQLLGKGDMLYMSTGGFVTRLHGPFVSDLEVERVVAFLKSQPNTVSSQEDNFQIDLDDDLSILSDSEKDNTEEDDLYQEAVSLIMREGRSSTSFLQRHLKVGYNRAARIIEIMERRGILSAPDHMGRRKIL